MTGKWYISALDKNRKRRNCIVNAKRVFINDEWENISLNGEILSYGYYHRYWNPDGTVNLEFKKDLISGKILDLKEKKERAIAFFFNQLDGEICDDITICVVPSHMAGTSNESGIAVLVRRLASSNRIDGVNYLIRTKTVDKKAYGGNRNREVDKSSISITTNKVSGSVILLVDDVSTSGNSLKVCRDILLQNGAERVAMFAIGKSV